MSKKGGVLVWGPLAGVLLVALGVGSAVYVRWRVVPDRSPETPCEWDDALKEEAVGSAVESLRTGSLVHTPNGDFPLLGSSATVEDWRLLFRNGLGISDAVFARLGVEPLPPEPRTDDGEKAVIVAFSMSETDSRQMVFDCYIGERFRTFSIRAFRKGDSRYFVFSLKMDMFLCG